MEFADVIGASHDSIPECGSNSFCKSSGTEMLGNSLKIM
jgi:hypothetical protein